MSDTNFNIVVLMTDQQRSIQHFPQDWVDKYLTNIRQLQNTGITLPNAITNSCRCSPVRGMVWTSTYPPRNGVVEVGGQLTGDIATLGYIMAFGDQATFPPPPATGGTIDEPGPYYSVVFNGKWHLGGNDFDTFSTEPAPLDPTTIARENTAMSQVWGMDNWDSPDAGTSMSSINTTGGGPYATDSRWQNDIRYAGDVQDFIDNYDGKGNFFLVASLVNPHDVWAYLPEYVYNGANTLQEVFPDFYYYVIDPGSTPPPSASAENKAFFDDLMAAFNEKNGLIHEWLTSGNYNDDLSQKPSVHTAVRNSYNRIYRDQKYDKQKAKEYAVNYLRFYAYLNYLSDQLHGEIYSALKKADLLDNTIILRLADHGETGNSHMGMVEKDANMYNETIRVPVIFSNPVLWPSAVSSDALMGLVDVLPTLMQFAGLDPTAPLYQNTANAAAPNAGQTVSMFQGRSWHDFLIDPDGTTPPADIALFTYDDGYGGLVKGHQWHIRGIVAAPGTYTVVTEIFGESRTLSLSLDSYYKYGVYYTLNANNAVNTTPYNAQTSPYGLQYECYQDYTGLLDPNNAGETDNIFFSEWGKDVSEWSALHQGLHALLSRQLTGADLTGPGNVYAAVTPDGWEQITS